MSALAKKWRRLREAAAVARYGATFGDAVALFACYLRLLVRPPGTDEQVVSLRLGTLVHPVTFRERDIFTFGEMLFEQQYRLPERLPAGAVGGRVVAVGVPTPNCTRSSRSRRMRACCA